MSRIVAKFGGSSLSDSDHIQRVAAIIISLRDQGHDVIVVVSAMQGQTDHLIELATELADQPSQREYDALLATGEQVSAALLAICLIKRGYPAYSINAFQLPIHTNLNHRNAQLSEIDNRKLLDNLRLGIISVVTGFQGINKQGDLTTLGRGGSDLTAVAVAAVIEADECRIYSDVDGVFNSDPNIVENARKISTLDCSEMFELSSSGAKILQSRAVELASKYHVPLHILSTFKPKKGTLIHFDESSIEQPVITAITSDLNHCYVSLIKIAKAFYQSGGLLSSLASMKIDIDMLNQHFFHDIDDLVSVYFTIKQEYALDTKAVINKISKQLNYHDCIFRSEMAKLTVVGIGMQSHVGIASRIFMTLYDKGIQVYMVSISEIKISIVVEAQYMALSVKLLHACFFSIII